MVYSLVTPRATRIIISVGAMPWKFHVALVDKVQVSLHSTHIYLNGHEDGYGLSGMAQGKQDDHDQLSDQVKEPALDHDHNRIRHCTPTAEWAGKCPRSPPAEHPPQLPYDQRGSYHVRGKGERIPRNPERDDVGWGKGSSRIQRHNSMSDFHDACCTRAMSVGNTTECR